MEPRKIEKPVELRDEGQTSPLSQPQRKRRFQIVKLEERIAPAQGGNGGGGPHSGKCVPGGMAG
jgi:hypothetical protein